jgi:hypothetical protein
MWRSACSSMLYVSLGLLDRTTVHGFRISAWTGLKRKWVLVLVVQSQLVHRHDVRAAYHPAGHLAEGHEMMSHWANHSDVLRSLRSKNVFDMTTSRARR